MQNLEDLFREAGWLNSLKSSYTNLAYDAILAIRIGRYNWALQQLEDYVEVLDKNIYVQIREPELQEVRLRGLVEVKEALEESRAFFEELTDDLYASDKSSKENLYEDFTEEMIDPYAQLGRIMNLLVELSQGTVL